jgi:hypothetical protein
VQEQPGQEGQVVQPHAQRAHGARLSPQEPGDLVLHVAHPVAEPTTGTPVSRRMARQMAVMGFE